MPYSDKYFTEVEKIALQFFEIADRTLGGIGFPYIVKYHGQFKSGDISENFESLQNLLKAYDILPRIVLENNQQTLYIQPVLTLGKTLKPAINLVFFLLTLISVLLTGGLYATQNALPISFWQAAVTLFKNGWPFAVSLLSILAAHEFGHYFAGRWHGIQVSLPFFIPFPLSMFGTMGAFINMRSIPKNRRALFDMAAAGPICGFVVSIVVLLIGLRLSSLSQIPFVIDDSSTFQVEGNSIIYLLLKKVVFREWLPKPSVVNDTNLFVYWLRYFFTSRPAPLGALDVMLHPVAWAGWAGLLVTGINLIPAGQLDGGHIVYSVFGKKIADGIFPVMVGALVLLGFAWNGWWLWAVLIFWLGRRHAEPLDLITGLNPSRRLIGIIILIVFLLVFIPVPITLIGS